MRTKALWAAGPALALLLSLSVFPWEGTGPTTLILVRHAEKFADGTPDPHLAAAGLRRAEDLAVILEHVDIAAIYSTPLKRTRATAAPMAERKGLAIREYGQDDERAFIRDVLARHRGETVLIVGHSNTVARMANAAAGREIYADLDDSDYDNLFMAVVDAAGRAVVHRLRFGGLQAAEARRPSGP